MWTIRSIPGKGRGLIALQNISKGSIVFSELPLAHIRLNKLSNHCSHCLVRHSSNCSCSSCFERFCSERCRNGFGKLHHNLLCPTPKERNGRMFPQLVDQLIAKLFSAQLIEPEEIEMNGWHSAKEIMEKINSLCFVDMSGDPEVQIYYQKLIEWFKTSGKIQAPPGMYLENLITLQLYTRVYGICRLNTFGIHADEQVAGEMTAYALCGKASLVNHSCVPNCEIVWDSSIRSPGTCLKTIQDIEAEDEITVAYIDVEQNAHRRNRVLRSVYGFQCSCAKCITEESNDCD